MIMFVADAFVEDYVGGAELTTEALIKASFLPAYKVRSRSVTPSLMSQNKDKFWMFGNFSSLSQECILYAVKNLQYSVLEYDYKYCIYRSPEKHEAHEGDCNCATIKQGKLVSIFYAKALQTWFMSYKQLQHYVDKFSFLKSSNCKVLNSVFSDETLDYIETLDTTNKNNKWIISNSPSWIKGKDIAVNYAIENGLDYELVWGLSHKELLQKLAVSKGVIYLPPGADTCPRFIMEAKMLGCELVLNDYVQHKDEEWFNTVDTTIKHCRSRTEEFWATLEDKWNLATPKLSYDNENTKFNIVVPFYNCESWILKCLESVKKQKYNNYKCFIIDDMSTDNSSQLIEKFIKDDDRFKFIKNKNKNFALGNIASVLNNAEHDGEDVNIILDGDDWLSSRNVLGYLNNVYDSGDCMMTYGTYVYYPNGSVGVEPSEYPQQVIESNTFREDQWRASHLRTFKHFLWSNLDMKDLQDEEGNYYKTAYDQALMLPLLEMSAERSKYIDKIMHVYNRSNPLNVDKIKQRLQYTTAMKIRGKKPYRRIK